MHTKPVLDVSMVVANFNNGRYLEEFFRSILCSTALPRELIFVDDGSTDDSLAIARRACDVIENLNVIALPKNVGFANALNAGIAGSTSTYIMRMDPDDILMPTRIERQYDYITRHDLDVVGGNAHIFHSATGASIGSTNFPSEHADIEKTIIKGENGVLHATVLGRAALFKSEPYIQDNVPAEDYDIFARFLKRGARFGNFSEPLIRYRIHDTSASARLRYSTILRTYELRDSIFGGHTPRWKIRTYYWFIKCYRNYLDSRSVVTKYLWAGLSSLCYPQKLVRKIARRVAYRPGR
ncbi:glycosyltransferase [Paraburkholderia sp. JPY432]|uniref:glycosyltransferase family 2 protein n=1 Tax=Paraburkholderia youngii TaxID=2782701 RepID=UPI0015963BCB|nr:glycosyltransferase [Paraburkholderia youngii]NVH74245.1 glycosyltransferase [Paraburkholderia youngii]